MGRLTKGGEPKMAIGNLVRDPLKSAPGAYVLGALIKRRTRSCKQIILVVN